MEWWSSTEGKYCRQVHFYQRVPKSVLGLKPFRRSKRLLEGGNNQPGSLKQAPVSVLDGANSQDQSPFFQRLPTEIRHMIYAFALNVQTVHVLFDGERYQWPREYDGNPEKRGRLVALACLADTENLHCSEF